MKYMRMFQNARSKTEMFLRSGFAFLIFLMIAVVFTASFSKYVKTSNENEIRARTGLSTAIKTDMAKCENIGRKMQYAGANIKDELLPELKIYLYCLSTMTQAYQESFGETGAPINQQYLSKIAGAAERLDRDYSCGYPADKSEKALIECLNEIGNLLKNYEGEK